MTDEMFIEILQPDGETVLHRISPEFAAELGTLAPDLYDGVDVDRAVEITLQLSGLSDSAEAWNLAAFIRRRCLDAVQLYLADGTPSYITEGDEP